MMPRPRFKATARPAAEWRHDTNAADWRPGRFFSAPAEALVQESLTSVFAQSGWRHKEHPYEGPERDNCITMQADNGGWGVLNTRYRAGAISELIISRLAAHAGLPVAPVFAHAMGRDRITTVSVIPFAHMTPGQHLKADDALLKHQAYMAPFLSMVGPDTDRHEENTCGDAESRAHFSEYDFESTDLANTLHERAYTEPLWNAAAEWRADLPGDAFEAGMAATQRITPKVIDTVLDLVSEDIRLPRAEKRAIKAHLRTQFARLSDPQNAAEVLPPKKPEFSSRALYEDLPPSSRWHISYRFPIQI
jgi:hypothetical protein